jgi:hypothetical protein
MFKNFCFVIHSYSKFLFLSFNFPYLLILKGTDKSSIFPTNTYESVGLKHDVILSYEKVSCSLEAEVNQIS